MAMPRSVAAIRSSAHCLYAVAPASAHRVPETGETLTEREIVVLRLVATGSENEEIADQLFITETTVRHHLTSIFEKLKVNSRLELVVHAFREKLVELPVEQTESI